MYSVLYTVTDEGAGKEPLGKYYIVQNVKCYGANVNGFRLLNFHERIILPFVHLYVCMYVFMYVCICVCIYIYTHKHINIYIFIIYLFI